MVVRQGVALAGVGLIVGLLGAITLSTIVSSMLYGIAATDPPTLAHVSLLLISVAAAASWISARRATQIHPVETLLSE